MKIDNDINPEKMPWLGRKLLWLDKPANVTLVYKSLIGVCVALFLTDLVYSRHGIFEFEHFWGFYALFGFFAFSFVIFASKALRKLVMRKETYYSPYVIDGEDYPEEGLEIASHFDD